MKKLSHKGIFRVGEMLNGIKLEKCDIYTFENIVNDFENGVKTSLLMDEVRKEYIKISNFGRVVREKVNDAKKLGAVIKHMCDLAGFRIDGSFVLVHRKTGRRWVVK